MLIPPSPFRLSLFPLIKCDLFLKLPNMGHVFDFNEAKRYEQWFNRLPNKAAFDLVERLEERLGPSDNPKYGLNYTITLTPVGVGITTDNAITRYNLIGVVEWELTDVMTRTRLTGGKTENFTSYSATGSTVAGLAAQEDAAQRLMRIIADQIVSQLLATSGQWTAE